MNVVEDLRSSKDGLSGSKLMSLLLVCGLSITFDGYDLVVYGTTVAAVMKEWGIGPAQAGWVGSIALIGMMLGALVVGTLADRIGRRRVLIASVAWFSVWMIVAAFAPNLAVFSAARFLCGVGLGGCMPTAAAMVVEYAPSAQRNFLYVIMQSGFAVGGILAALLALVMMPSLGWRSMYLFGGVVPLIIVVLPALRWLPESVEYLMTHGRVDEGRGLAARLGLPEPALRSHEERSVRISGLFRRNFGVATVFFWLASFCALLLVYGLNTWLPEIMRKQGYPLGSALTFLLVFNLGSIIGLLIGGYVADRYGSKPVIAVSFALAAISAVLLSMRPDMGFLYLLVAVGGYGAIGTQTLINPFVTSYYPAALRSTGISWALGIGRLGAITGPIIGGWILASSLGNAWNFYVFAIVAALGAVAVALVPRAPAVDQPVVAAADGA